MTSSWSTVNSKTAWISAVNSQNSSNRRPTFRSQCGMDIHVDYSGAIHSELYTMNCSNRKRESFATLISHFLWTGLNLWGTCGRSCNYGVHRSDTPPVTTKSIFVKTFFSYVTFLPQKSWFLIIVWAPSQNPSSGHNGHTFFGLYSHCNPQYWGDTESWNDWLFHANTPQYNKEVILEEL